MKMQEVEEFKRRVFLVKKYLLAISKELLGCYNQCLKWLGGLKLR